MRHTINEAASLVGRTRRSLYRAMTEGRLSYGVGADDRRYIDTAELLRAYGPFEAPSQNAPPEMSQGVTLPDDLAEMIAQAVGKAVAEAVEPLRKEIELLRQQNADQRVIEHLPESSPATSRKGMTTKPHSFADLLSGLDQG